MRFIATATFGCGLLFAVTPFFPYFTVLLLLTFIGGGTVNAIYPVGMAVVGDELSESLYPRAAALLSAAFYIGGIFGPLVLSRSMDRFGYDFLFYTAAAATFLYALLPLSQVIRGRR
jgi:MFS family permease